MEKKPIQRGVRLNNYQHVSRIMKALVVFLFVGVCSLTANTYSQGTGIQLNVKNTRVKDVFIKIEEQSSYLFLLSENIENKLNKKIDITIDSDSLEEVLELIVSRANLQYEVVDKQVVIYDKQSAPESHSSSIEEVKVESEQQPGPHMIVGLVTDKKDGLPVIGANVVVLKEKTGTVTNEKGQFSLSVIPGVTIRISFIGYESQDIKITDQTTLSIQLVEDAAQIEEVVITGYANIRKESFTGNAIEVGQEEILAISQKDIISSLQVFDPSLRYVKDNIGGSNPNKMPEFYMRGQSGIGVKELDKIDISEAALTHNPNLPIFIMDGYEVSVEKVYDYDPYQIKSITILKDAAATAMYGSRAANGVIVIETIAPIAGKLRATYNFVGTGTFPDLSDYNLMNAEEKLEAERLAGYYDTTKPGINATTANNLMSEYINKSNQLKRGINTDWIAQPLRNEYNQKHSLHLEGGGDNIRLGVNLKYDVQNGVMKESDRKRKEAEFVANYIINHFQINNRVTYSRMDSRNSPYGSFGDFTWKLPYDELVDADGNPLLNTNLWHSGSSEMNRLNPLYEALQTQNFSTSNYDAFTNNTSLIYRYKKFQIRSQLSVQYQQNGSTNFVDPSSGRYSSTAAWNTRGSLSLSKSSSLRINGNFIANYASEFRKNNLNLQIGLNVNESKNKGSSESYLGFPSGSKYSPNYAASITNKPSYTDNHTRLAGLFFAANYSYDNIYLLDVSARLDGSSEFGTEEKYAPFWSCGLGINIHNYAFLKDNEILSRLKLTTTMGELGKVNFPPYVARDTYRMMDTWYPTGVGAVLMAMGNPYLKWEITRTNDVMLDVGLLKNRFNLKAAYYNRVTSDLINDIDLPASSGFTSYKGNVGRIKNSGYEVDLRFNIISTKDVLIGVYGNFASNRNVILDISSSLKAYNDLVNQQYANYQTYGNRYNYVEQYSKPHTKYVEGGSTTSIFGMKSLGINPMDGKEIFVKKDGTITYDWDASEQVIIGNSQPKGQGAFGINALYKGFTLYASFLYEFGSQEYNSTLVSKVENVDLYNRNTDRRALLERWQKPGDMTTLKDIADRQYTTRPTSRFIQDFNLLSFNSLSIGYTFERKLIEKVKLSMLKLSLNANNVGKLTSVRQERGLSYPFARTFDVTLNVSF